MNKIISFILACLFVSSCSEIELSTTKLDIEGEMRWSSSLLDFVIPVFTYTDASGLNKVKITDIMMDSDGTERICHFNIEYAYASESDSPCLTVEYLLQENTSIVPDSLYEFSHNLLINGVKHNGEIVSLSSTSVNVGLKDVVQGYEVEEYMRELIATPDKRTLYVNYLLNSQILHITVREEKY